MCRLDSSTFDPSIRILELARLRVLMPMDSGFAFSRSPISYHLYSTNPCGSTLPRHYRDIADHESNMQAFPVIENPDSPIPDSSKSPDTRPSKSTVLSISGNRSSGYRHSPSNDLVFQLAIGQYAISRVDLTVLVTPDRQRYFLLSLKILNAHAVIFMHLWKI
jgi:hypothetical protein